VTLAKTPPTVNRGKAERLVNRLNDHVVVHDAIATKMTHFCEHHFLIFSGYPSAS
jgi:GTP cyclohydrolase I